MKTDQTTTKESLTLVLGGTGKTGNLIAKRLRKLDVPIRIASRSGKPEFDWNKPDSWNAVLDGVTSVYISYAPDLAVPCAPDTIQTFVERAVEMGVQRLILLSGRGEDKAEICERIVQQSGIEWTILRASWFYQNFTEGEFAALVQAGELALPAGDVREPFVDTRDIADVAVAALTEPWHQNKIYELTGPRLMSFKDIALEISKATGRRIQYTRVPLARFKHQLSLAGMPDDSVWLLEYLFTTVLDGRNESVADGVYRALCRLPRDFSEFANDAVDAGIWPREKPTTADPMPPARPETDAPRIHAY